MTMGTIRRHATATRRGLLLVALLSACTSDKAPPPNAAGSSSAAPVAAATVTLSGDDALVRAFSRPDVRCRFPDVDGTSIALLSTPQELVFRIRVQRAKITVLVSDSAGHERDFSGTGVTQFDAAGGAQIDSTLAEVPVPTGTPGDLGRLTAIKGSVDCSGQSPGTSTLALTGTRLEDPRVECNPEGAEVVVSAVADLGRGRALVNIGLRLDGVDIQEFGTTTRGFVGPAGTVTLIGNGAQVAADLVEQNATPPHTFHLEGDVVCGTPVS